MVRGFVAGINGAVNEIAIEVFDALLADTVRGVVVRVPVDNVFDMDVSPPPFVAVKYTEYAVPATKLGLV